MDEKLLKVDGVLWKIDNGIYEPICPVHHLRLYPFPDDWSEQSSIDLRCEECPKVYRLPRFIAEEKIYIKDKIDSKRFKQMKILNLDDEAIPIYEDKISSKDGKFFVKAILTQSKIGQRLVIYAGEKGAKEKTQIFIEPEIKRLAFDQKDLHPSDVFCSLDATFKDGTTMRIKNKNS